MGKTGGGGRGGAGDNHGQYLNVRVAALETPAPKQYGECHCDRYLYANQRLVCTLAMRSTKFPKVGWVLCNVVLDVGDSLEQDPPV